MLYFNAIINQCIRRTIMNGCGVAELVTKNNTILFNNLL